MKLLVSVKDEIEAINAIEGKADIIDIKNPKEGALGACMPSVIKKISEISHNYNVLCSSAIGDVSYAGNASLAAVGAAMCEIDYIKVGLKTENVVIASSIMKNIVKEIRNYKNFHKEKIKVVAVAFADWMRANTFPVEEIYEVGLASNCDVLMIDTAIKDKKNLFDFMKENEIKNFAKTAKEFGFEVAVAGSLGKREILILKSIDGIDVIGVRTAVCKNFERNNEIDKNMVKELKEIME